MELKPIYENCKSYYKKAIILDLGAYVILSSYNTEVCVINTAEHSFVVYGGNCYQNYLTTTTLRHIKEFLKQYFYNGNVEITKKDLLKHLY